MDDFEADENFSAIVKGTPTRMTQLLTGVITVDDLDDEELLRGQTRGSDGKFHGGGTKMVPRAMHKEIQRRIHERGLGKMKDAFFEAIEVMVQEMRNEDASSTERQNAAKYIIERVAGKTPDKVEMAVEMRKYEHVMSGIMRLVPDEEGVYGDGE